MKAEGSGFNPDQRGVPVMLHALTCTDTKLRNCQCKGHQVFCRRIHFIFYITHTMRQKDPSDVEDNDTEDHIHEVLDLDDQEAGIYHIK